MTVLPNKYESSAELPDHARAVQKHITKYVRTIIQYHIICALKN